MSDTDPMQLSERELLGLTADLDALHHEQTMPAMKASLAEWGEDLRAHAAAEAREETPERSVFARRRFFAVAGGVAGAGLLAACSSSSSSSSSSSAPAASASSSAAAGGTATASAAAMGGEGQSLSGDLLVVGLAASLESTAINTYMAGIKAATAGKLGTVPPAVVTFAQTALSQHTQHRAAWNSVLTAAGKQAVTAADPAVAPTVSAALAKVTTVTALAKLALLLENTAGQTYQNGLSVITSSAGIKTAASIEPVEFQHAAILNFILGTYPVPSAFTAVSLARPVSDYQT